MIEEPFELLFKRFYTEPYAMQSHQYEEPFPHAKNHVSVKLLMKDHVFAQFYDRMVWFWMSW